MHREPSENQLALIESGLAPFRDSGCRITLSNLTRHVLIDSISGNWVFAPDDNSEIGFEFSQTNDSRNSKPISIQRTPYAHTPELCVYVGENSRTFIIYQTPRDRDNLHSLVRNGQLYLVPSNWLIDKEIGIVIS